MLKRYLGTALLPVLLISWNAQTFAACEGDDGSSPISNSNQSTLSKTVKNLQVKVDAQVQSKVQKLDLIDILKADYAVLNNPQAPNHAQMQIDYNTAMDILAHVSTDYASSGSGTKTSALGSEVIISPISPVSPIQKVDVTTYQQFGELLEKNKNISTNAKYFLLSTVLGKMGDYLWSNDPYQSVPLSTTLTKEFNAFQKDTKTAGICGPIHTFGAFMAQKLGLQSVGMVGTDWQAHGQKDVGHAVLTFKDPDGKGYLLLNYDNLETTRKKYLSEAVEQHSLNMSPLSASTTVEARTATADPHLYETQNNRTRVVMEQVRAASDKNTGSISVQAGTLDNRISAQKKIVGNENNRVSVYGTGMENREEDSFQFASVGVSAHAEGHKALNSKVSVNGKAEISVGGFVVRDETPKGNADTTAAHRVATGAIGTTFEQASVNWQGKKVKGEAGVQTKVDELDYDLSPNHPAAGAPYNRIRAYVTVEPSKNLEVHAKSDSFVYTKSLQDQKFVTHPLAQNAGVAVKKDLKSGKVSVKDTADAFEFGSITTKAFGLRNEFSATYHNARKMNYTVSTEVAKNINGSGDDFNTYATTCRVGGAISKQFSKVRVDVNADGSCNNHVIFNLMGENAMDRGISTTQARFKSGVNFNF